MLESAKEIREFLAHILTPVERTRLERRWEGVQLKFSGLSDRAIVSQSGISAATVTRAAALTRSPFMGKVLQRLAVSRD